MQVNNKKELLVRRRALRNSMTNEEKILWTKLKNRNLKGYKFRRQHSIGFYILDFYCPVAKLAIEIDGAQHYQEENMLYDNKRTEFLEATGIIVLRFSNLDVRNNLNGILSEIIEKLKVATTPHSPQLSK